MRALRAAFALAMVAACAATPALGADPLAAGVGDRIADSVRATLDELDVPGAAVVVVSADGVVYAEGFGEAAAGRAATPQTPFHVASVSKSVTAIAVRQLVDDGRLDLDTPIHTLLPWFDDEVPGHAALTVGDLLAHTSGWTTGDGLANRLDESTDDDALERNVRRLAATPPTEAVGQFAYSNANYDVLGLVVAAASGTSYEAYVRDHILNPLGMVHTHLNDEAARAHGLAQGHLPLFAATIPYDVPFVRGSVPSSFIAASAEDLGRLVAALLAGGALDGQRILTPQGTRALLTPLVDTASDSGYGWGLWRYPLYQALELPADPAGSAAVPLVVGHDGSHATYASNMLLLPEAGYGVVVLMNKNDEAASSRYYQLAHNVAGLLLGNEPAPLTAYDDPLSSNGRLIVLAVLAVQLAGIALAIRRFRRGVVARSAGVGFWLGQVVLPLVVDLGVPVVLWWLAVDTIGAGPASIPLLVVLSPDIGWGVVLITVIGIGWGATRTMLTLRRTGREPAAVAVDASAVTPSPSEA